MLSKLLVGSLILQVLLNFSDLTSQSSRVGFSLPSRLAQVTPCLARQPLKPLSSAPLCAHALCLGRTSEGEGGWATAPGGHRDLEDGCDGVEVMVWVI